MLPAARAYDRIRTMLNKVVVLLVVGILGCGTAGSDSDAKTGQLRPKIEPTPAAPTSAYMDLRVLEGIEPLRVVFNSDADKLRVIALLEPA